jgi:hypothetical protein
MRADVTPLDPAQRAELGVYLFTDTDNDDVEDSYVRQDGSCTVVESPPGTFTATCVVELAHFSVYSIIAPRDSDGDGVPDDFAGRVDSCRLQDATGFDVDENGCIDSFSGLAGLVGTLVSEGVIDAQMANSLLMKVNNAAASATVDNVCAAIQQLLALEAQVRALTGKKISAAAATRVLRYADSVIAAQRSGLPAGSNCG